MRNEIPTMTKNWKKIGTALLAAVFLVVFSTAALAQYQSPSPPNDDGRQPGQLERIAPSVGDGAEDGAALALTGGDITLFVAAGVVLIGSGLMVLRYTRRRRRLSA